MEFGTTTHDFLKFLQSQSGVSENFDIIQHCTLNIIYIIGRQYELVFFTGI